MLQGGSESVRRERLMRAAWEPNRKVLKKKKPINRRKTRDSRAFIPGPSSSFLTGIRVSGTGNNFHASFRPPGLPAICQWELIPPSTYQFHAESAGLELGKPLTRLLLFRLERLGVQDLLTLVA